MTVKEAIYDIREIFSNYFLVESNRLDLDYALHLINSKRARIIYEDYNRKHMINPTLVQDMGIDKTSKIDFSNDLDDTEDCSCTLAKVDIPPVVKIQSDRERLVDVGLVQVKSTCGVYYDPTDRRSFYTMLKYDPQRAKSPMYFREGGFVFMNPWRAEVNLHLVLENPMDGYIIRSGNITNGKLIPGEGYTVVDGNIQYDTGSGVVTLQRGQTFTASLVGGLSWVGNGVVQFTNKKRAMTYDDEYPIDMGTWHAVKELIKKDLDDGKISLVDVENDTIPEEGEKQSLAS